MEEFFVLKYEDDLCAWYESYFFEFDGAKNWTNLYQNDWRCWKLYKNDELVEEWINPNAD